MLFSVEQEFVGREEIRSPLKTPAGKASLFGVESYFGQREKECLARFPIKDL